MDFMANPDSTPDIGGNGFRDPYPLDHAARLAASQDAQRGMMAEHGTDIIEQLLNLPKGLDIVDGQHDRWTRASPGHEQWAQIARICTEFYEGDQWTEEERNILSLEGRPVVTKNKVAPLIRLLQGYFRQNKYDIRFMPGNDGTGTDEVAEVLCAVMKQISENNSSNWTDAQVFQDGLFTGRGFWDIRLDFARNRLGENKEIILDPFNFYIDPEADGYDPNGVGGQSPWKFFIYNRWMSIMDIFLLYGKLPASEVGRSGASIPISTDLLTGNIGVDISPKRWFGLQEFLYNDIEAGLRRGGSIYDHLNRQRKLIRVLDCQHRQLKKVNFFVDLETGAEKVIPDDVDPAKVQRIMQWAQMRGVPVTVGTDYKEVIRWTITAGDRVLYDKWSPYENYTAVPYFPYFRRGKTQSPIKDLLDPQREINKRSAAFLHIIMSTANSGWMWEDGALDDEMETILEEEGSRPGIHIKYQEGYEAPKRIEPAATPVAMKKLEVDATLDMKEIAGINDSALGQLDVAQSGVAVQARQKQAIVGAETYFDNFSHSRELKGRQHLSLIQNFYTEPRILRVRAGHGKDEQTMINYRNAAGEIVNNVTQGRYDVSIDEAPMSQTFQQGQFDDAIRLAEMGVPIPPDILVELSSVPQKDEIKRRLNEERLIALNQARISDLANKMSLGIPPEAPVPPIVTDGSPAVVDLSKQVQPTMLPAAPTQPSNGMVPPSPAAGVPGQQATPKRRRIMDANGNIIQQ